MPLTSTTDLLLEAQRGGYAVGAFNVENMEMVQAVVEAAEQLHAPVILQTTPSTVRYGGLDQYHAMVAAAAASAAVPVALHLDHGDSFELAAQALRTGYTSVMFDGSSRPYEENVAVSAAVVQMCRPAGVPVEGELGRVGGKEDSLSVDAVAYTDPAQAAEFVERTGVSSLAVAIGTAHGVYSGVPVLDVALLGEIRAQVEVPLVLHGGSGLEDAAVARCIQTGIAKVNFATELRIAFSRAVAAYLTDAPTTIDPKKYGAVGRDAVRTLAAAKIRLCAAGHGA